jgi:hypothetical protein
MESTRRKDVQLLCWFGLSVLILALDFATGPLILFPILYLIPVALVSWYNGRWWGVVFAVAMPIVRLSFSVLWPSPWSMPVAVLNTAIRAAVLAGFAELVDRTARQKRELEKEMRMLRGLLPICSFCKKIRDEEGNWEVLERYITTHSEAQFSHGVCPECARKHYSGYRRG